MELEKRQKAEKESLRKFRTKIEEKINIFVQDDSKTSIEFPPMDKIYRSIMYIYAIPFVYIFKIMKYIFVDMKFVK